jgi:serine/threonine protein kinase
MSNNLNIRASKRIIANRYKVNKTIIGGMGVIYLCDDTEQDDFPVALKTFKPQYLSEKNIRAQFLHEAAIWVEIGWHPNIVQAYRTEYVPNSHEVYLVLEMLPALSGKKDPSLRSCIMRGAGLSLEKTLNLLLDVTRGMKYATTKIPGLIHCDLKPENIYIGPDGRARIGDFGLVTVPKNILENLSGSLIRDKRPRVRFVGTPLYMSPEQWRNRKVSISSDIYSLGCICLEMLTGDYIIRGRHIKTIAEEHIRGGAMKRLGEVDIPDTLKVFLSKCLHPDSLQRFQSWENVEQELIKLHDELLHQKIEPENLLSDVSLKTQVLKGETILSIGEAYLDILEIPTAIKCFEKARSIGQGQNYRELIARAEANIGLACSKLSQYELAISHYQRAIAHNIKCGNHEYAILNYGNIGNAYFQLGDFEKAQDNITKVIEYTNQMSHEKVNAFWNANIANAVSTSVNKRSILEYFLYTLEVEQKFVSDVTSIKLLEVLDRLIRSVGDQKNHTLLLNQNN